MKVRSNTSWRLSISSRRGDKVADGFDLNLEDRGGASPLHEYWQTEHLQCINYSTRLSKMHHPKSSAGGPDEPDSYASLFYVLFISCGLKRTASDDAIKQYIDSCLLCN